MRIAFFSDNFYPELSGVSDSIRTLGTALAARGHEVLFSVPAYPPRAFIQANLVPQELSLESRMGVERRFSLPFPKSPTGQGRFALPFGISRRMHTFAPEVVHTQFFFSMGLNARTTARHFSIPLIGTSHTATREFLAYSPFRTAWSDRLILRYMNWFYSQCDLVTAPSASVFEEMRTDGYTGTSQVVSNPIDTNLFSPIQDREFLKRKFGFGNFTLIHAGRFSPERHIDVLIDALVETRRTVPDAELAIAGRGQLETSLREKARAMGIGGAVKFLGLLSSSALAEAYNASEVFLTASTCETQSLVLMQAMACGLPAIGVRARALPEYINTQNGFLVEPGDAHAIGIRAAQLILDKGLQKKLGRNGRAFVSQFSISSIASAWEQIYTTVCAEYDKKNMRQVTKLPRILSS